jgi:hypothetical protein
VHPPYTSLTKNPGVAVNTSLALALAAAAAANLPSLHVTRPVNAATQPVFIQMPKGDGGLTLYNPKGQIVARCDQKDDAFSNCKMEPGFTFDDVMNAWVHAYQDVQK